MGRLSHDTGKQPMTQKGKHRENMEGKNEKTKQTHQEERTEHNRQKGVDK
jgi:hypothetical protein